MAPDRRKPTPYARRRQASVAIEEILADMAALKATWPCPTCGATGNFRVERSIKVVWGCGHEEKAAW
mgnify:CR=1 FL=1